MAEVVLHSEEDSVPLEVLVEMSSFSGPKFALLWFLLLSVEDIGEVGEVEVEFTS